MTTPEDAVEPATRPRWHSPVLLGAVALVVAAAAVAAWFALAWVRAGNDESLTRAQTRDEVDRIARQAIITFNTLDYRDVDAGLNNWLTASTGPLYEELAGRLDNAKQVIAQAKNVTSATVFSLAVTDLDDFAGTATVIAVVEQTVTPEGKEPVKKQVPIKGALQRTPEGWKLSALEGVQFAG